MGSVNLAFRAQLVVPEQRQLYDYWIACGGTKDMPVRSDINPADIPRLLPYLSLIDVDDELDRIGARAAQLGASALEVPAAGSGGSLQRHARAYDHALGRGQVAPWHHCVTVVELEREREVRRANLARGERHARSLRGAREDEDALVATHARGELRGT